MLQQYLYIQKILMMMKCLINAINNLPFGSLSMNNEILFVTGRPTADEPQPRVWRRMFLH